MDTLIREAVPVDVTSIVELVRVVAAENRWVRTEVPFDTAEPERRTIERMQTDELVAFVAEADGAIVGQLSMRGLRAQPRGPEALPRDGILETR